MSNNKWIIDKQEMVCYTIKNLKGGKSSMANRIQFMFMMQIGLVVMFLTTGFCCRIQN